MANTPTPHILATPEDFAPTVLMPGDPLRSKYIAENFLTDPKLVNNVRGVQGYTGIYRGQRVSVMASGMGMPSIGLYSYELFAFFGVEQIIRVGSIGALHPDLKMGDLVLAQGASTDSNYMAQYNLPGTLAPIGDFGLLTTAAAAAKAEGVQSVVGNVLSSDVYYGDDASANDRWAKMGILGIEMEAAALYANAARLGKRALAIFTVSNHIRTGEEMPTEQRERGLGQMIRVALETAYRTQTEK